MIREPIDFLQSYHSQSIFSNIENEKKLLSALNIEKYRFVKNQKSESTFCKDYLYYSKIVKFSEQIKRYLEIFPKDNIKIILFDDFKKNSKKNTENLIDNFLKLKKSNNINYDIINEAKYKRFNIISSIYVFTVFKFLLPKNIYNYIRDNIVNKIIVVNKKNKSNITNNDIIKLKQTYKQEVINLNKLLHENKLIDKNINLVKLWSYNKI
jgi:hypothetical protein